MTCLLFQNFHFLVDFFLFILFSFYFASFFIVFVFFSVSFHFLVFSFVGIGPSLLGLWVGPSFSGFEFALLSRGCGLALPSRSGGLALPSQGGGCVCLVGVIVGPSFWGSDVAFLSWVGVGLAFSCVGFSVLPWWLHLPSCCDGSLSLFWVRVGLPLLSSGVGLGSFLGLTVGPPILGPRLARSCCGWVLAFPSLSCCGGSPILPRGGRLAVPSRCLVLVRLSCGGSTFLMWGWPSFSGVGVVLLSGGLTLRSRGCEEKRNQKEKTWTLKRKAIRRNCDLNPNSALAGWVRQINPKSLALSPPPFHSNQRRRQLASSQLGKFPIPVRHSFR